MMDFSKGALLAPLLWRRPGEFWDRLATAWESRTERLRATDPSYAVQSWPNMTRELGRVLSVNADQLLAEQRLVETERLVRESQSGMSAHVPFRREHDADFRLARLCYLACRALQPEVVVETGVAYGVTTSFVLAALQANQRGRLHSIDLPPLGERADQFVGFLVPPDLRGRWVLHRGSTRRLLAPLLKTLGRVGIFIHDSLHTYANMRMEFELAAAYFDGNAILISDDVQDNSAFADWAAAARPVFWAVAAEESKLGSFGVAVIRHAVSVSS